MRSAGHDSVYGFFLFGGLIVGWLFDSIVAFLVIFSAGALWAIMEKLELVRRPSERMDDKERRKRDEEV